MEEQETSIPEGFKKQQNDIFKFEKVGDKVQGVLVNVELSKQHNNKVYTLKQNDGTNKIVFGTSVIDSEMAGIEMGSEVIIVHTGTKPSTKGNDTKLFDIYTKLALADKSA